MLQMRHNHRLKLNIRFEPILQFFAAQRKSAVASSQKTHLRYDTVHEIKDHCLGERHLMRLFTALILFLVAPSCADVANSQKIREGTPTNLFETFMNVCVNNLHAPTQSAKVLEELGWSRTRLPSFGDGGLFGNIVAVGFKNNEGNFFVSPDRNSGFVFGPADNDLNPNSKCMLATTSHEVDAFSEWSKNIFVGQVYEDTTGRRFGNRLQSWQTATFPQNISADTPITNVTLHSGLLATGNTTADTQVSVTGLRP
jgi:hypothetical protein